MHVARFVSATQVDDEARAEAAKAIVDTLAVMVAGGATAPVRLLAETLTPMSSGTPSFWSESLYAPQDAATLFGMAAHMLDYDDVSMLTVCHPSAPVLSALLATVPWGEISGAELLDAFVVGTEVSIRLGEAMGFRHYGLGFHATSTLGPVGAAAACARLRWLDAEKTAHALAIAASFSSGLRKNFGSMVKPLHVGIAASNGLKAAAWAAAGIEGAAEVFEAGGFLSAFSGGATDAWPAVNRIGAPFAISTPGFERKRYPCCYMLHKIIEATVGLAREASIDLDSLVHASIEMPPGGSKPLNHPRPVNGLEARFSAPYAVLAGIADRRMDLSVLADHAVLRPEIQSRLQLVTIAERDGPMLNGQEIDHAPVTVALHLRDGSRHSRTVVVTPGSPADPVTDEQLLAKWLDCFRQVDAVVDVEASASLFRRGLDIEREASFGGWLEALRRPAADPRQQKVKRIA
jgi:2-methylcitrate dehydratase PrpD